MRVSNVVRAKESGALSNTMFVCFVCFQLGWVGFLVVCSLDKINLNPRKIICCGKKSGQNATFDEKSGQNATFDLIFSRVGSAMGWGVRRFHNNNNNNMFSTQPNLVNRQHRINSVITPRQEIGPPF